MTRIRVMEVVGDHEGGGTRFVVSLLQGLDPSRFAFTLVAPQAEWLAKACAARGVTYLPVPLKRSRFSRELRLRLRAILAQQRPDVIHAHGTRAAWFVLGSDERRAPLIYSEHLFSFDARRGPLRWPWLAIERRICRGSEYLTTSCQRNARFVLARRWTTPERIWTTHYGVDLAEARAQAARALSRAELGIPADAPVIGTVGRLIPQKGFAVLIDAAPALLARFPAARFLMVGDGTERAALAARCRVRGVSEHFHWRGADPAPWRQLATCDLIALPSLWEGLPFTAVEAQAIGLPVVASDVSGMSEIVHHEQSGLLVPPGDAAALAAALIQLLGAPERRAAMGAAGRESARRYALEDAIVEIASLYERVWEQGRGQAETRGPGHSERGETYAG